MTSSSWEQIEPGLGRFAPPEDVLDYVFSEETKQRWAERNTPNVQWRLRVLGASGPYPSDSTRANEIRCLRAKKAAWDTYLYTAFACGMMNDERGADILARLRSNADDDFRSGIAECLACWFLAGRMRYALDPIAVGRDGRNLDMRILIDNVDVGVEVKAPYRERPVKGGWTGGESDKIAQSMDAANKQFRDDRPNILILVPHLRIPMYQSRDDLLHAAYGFSQLAIPINFDTEETGDPYEQFVAGGRFLNRQRPGGKPLKPDGLPGFRRISAVISIEETIVERHPMPDLGLFLCDKKLVHDLWPAWDEARQLHFSDSNRAWIGHEVLVLHNPHAYQPLDLDIFSEFPQFVPEGNSMKWTDGHPVSV